MTDEPEIQMQPIESSALKSFGYDQATGRMRVQTHTGKVYEYENVSMDRYAAFTGAASPGRFWNDRIKPNHPGREIKPKASK